MEDDFDKLKSKLVESEQEHILNFWHDLKEEEKKRLKLQIENIDFMKLNELYKNSNKKELFSMETISPIPYINSLAMDKKEKERYIKIGEDIIKKGKVAVISMAGGQRNKAWLSWPKSYF